jgi:hypothetical protein
MSLDSAAMGRANKALTDLDSAKSEIDVKINEAKATFNGSPRGVFATLALLQADTNANTTEGKKYPYLVSADGHWYFWNGTAWTDGGVYLGVGAVYTKAETDMIKSELDGKLLLADDIKGTTQNTTFNPDGTVQKIQHINGSSIVLREDVFTYATNLITEVRTLSTLQTITFKYHLDTLQTEVI